MWIILAALALVHALLLGGGVGWRRLCWMWRPTLPTMVMIADDQQARSLDLQKRNPLQRARAYIPITVAMLITALCTAEGISHTLESRAVGASRRPTALHPLRFTAGDALWTLLILAVSAALPWAGWAWTWGWGLGACPI